MADITVTIPTDKIPLVRDAVKDYEQNFDMTDAEILVFVQEQMVARIQHICTIYQYRLHNDTFVFEDPLG